MADANIDPTCPAPSLFQHPLLQAMEQFMVPYFGRGAQAGGGWNQAVLLATLVLMAMDSAPTLSERFAVARQVFVTALPVRSGRRLGRTYQGFIKALKLHGLKLILQVQAHLRAMVRAIAQEHWPRLGWVAFCVDSSKSNVPRTRANEKHFGIGGKRKSGPQMLLTMLLHMGTGLPWAWRIGQACDAERDHLRQMASLLPKGALLVADAGFTGFELFRFLQQQGLHFLVRVGANVTLLTELGLIVEERDDTVYLWPTNCRDQPPLVLRIIRIKAGKKPVVLVTSVLDEQQLTEEQAGVFYRMRWGVEVFFRSLKQTLQRRKMRSAAPRQAEMELHGSLLGLTLLGLMSVSAIIKRRQDPLSWSVAGSLRAVRHTMRSAKPGSRSMLVGKLGRALTDTYRRKSSKKARHWPHKKNDRPPGEPHVRAATDAEITRAKKVTPQQKAA